MTATADGDTISGKLRTATRAIRPYLDEPRVIEILLNADGRVWVDRAGEGMSLTDTVMTPQEAESFLRFVAAESEATLTRDNPTLAGTLPHWDARVQGWMPPAVAKPAFAIRKRSPVVFSLDDYVDKQVLTPEQRDALVRAVLDRKNILIGGGAGTGKTTFANALLRVVAERTNDRLYIAEDRPELQCRAPNVLFVRTVRNRYSTQDAIFDALRGRPDRIIVGELRDGTALELLKAWNTGHPGGIATIHANDTPRTLTRFCQLIEEEIYPAPRDIVAEAINVCVHLTLDVRAPAGRRLSGLDEVRGYDVAAQRWLLAPLA
jgi:P-type conjugative transfer ATPase TrbB